MASAVAAIAAPKSLFRSKKKHEHHRVTYVELFFDLVFVFAVTQLSHKLLGDFGLRGALETGMLMLAVWWVWIYTSWFTNWLDPDRAPVRLLMFALMLAGLGLSMSLPRAFEARGLAFASCHAAMQIGRTFFMWWAAPREDVRLRLTFARILSWFVVTVPFWIAGGLCEGDTRIALWGLAIGIEYLGPSVRYWTPGLGASKVSDWAIEGGHLAERCGLFIIIALGESVLVTGATFAQAPWMPSTFVGFGTAFAGTVAMWWIYFDTGAEVGVERITQARDPGRLGRLAYTYLHLPIVLGIILSAVADELVLAHPTGHTELPTAISSIGGPLAYLVGVLLFKYSLHGRFQLSHLAGIGLLLLLAAFAMRLPPLGVAGGAAIILVVVAVWESVSLRAAE
jgi:low temperature requirement protein LtrA